MRVTVIGIRVTIISYTYIILYVEMVQFIYNKTNKVRLYYKCPKFEKCYVVCKK